MEALIIKILFYKKYGNPLFIIFVFLQGKNNKAQSHHFADSKSPFLGPQYDAVLRYFDYDVIKKILF